MTIAIPNNTAHSALRFGEYPQPQAVLQQARQRQTSRLIGHHYNDAASSQQGAGVPHAAHLVEPAAVWDGERWLADAPRCSSLASQGQYRTGTSTARSTRSRLWSPPSRENNAHVASSNVSEDIVGWRRGAMGVVIGALFGAAMFLAAQPNGGQAAPEPTLVGYQASVEVAP